MSQPAPPAIWDGRADGPSCARTAARRGACDQRRRTRAPPDAIIAATALEHRLGLAARNRKQFDRVAGLRVRTL
ncbi:hypothetical protein BH23ACT2_BH23ACT2_13990 [soil metagenome]